MENKTLVKIIGFILFIFSLNSCEKTPDISPSNEIIFSRRSLKEINEIEIWITDSDGRNQDRIIKKEAIPLLSAVVVWSPNGKKIAFRHWKESRNQDIETWLKEIGSGKYEDKISSKIYLIDYPEKRERILTDDSLKCREAFSWSPDGKYLVFAAGEKKILESDIYVIEVESRKIEKIASTPNDDMQPMWSPDGKNIAFISEPDYGSKSLNFEYIKTQGNSDIYLVNVESKELIKLTNNPTNDRDISWSPDGRKIAYVSWRGNNEIFVIDIDTRNEIRLTNTSDDECRLAWSPDGKKIAYISDQMLYLMDSDGKGKEKLTDKTQCYISYEGRVNWSADSRKIVFSAQPPHPPQDETFPPDIYIIDIENKELKNLTNTPDYWEANPSWRPIVK